MALPANLAAVNAQDPGLIPNPRHQAARIIAAELAMSQASADLQALTAQKPAGLADSLHPAWGESVRLTYERSWWFDACSPSLSVTAAETCLRVGVLH